jgi:hypothetical protein
VGDVDSAKRTSYQCRAAVQKNPRYWLLLIQAHANRKRKNVTGAAIAEKDKGWIKRRSNPQRWLNRDNVDASRSMSVRAKRRLSRANQTPTGPSPDRNCKEVSAHTLTRTE